MHISSECRPPGWHQSWYVFCVSREPAASRGAPGHFSSHTSVNCLTQCTCENVSRPGGCQKPAKHPAHCKLAHLLHLVVATRRARCVYKAFARLLTCGSTHQVHTVDIADSWPNENPTALALLHHSTARPSADTTLAKHGKT